MIYDRWWGPRDLISNGFGQRRKGGREEGRSGKGSYTYYEVSIYPSIYRYLNFITSHDINIHCVCRYTENNVMFMED